MAVLKHLLMVIFFVPLAMIFFVAMGEGAFHNGWIGAWFVIAVLAVAAGVGLTGFRFRRPDPLVAETIRRQQAEAPLMQEEYRRGLRDQLDQM